MKYPTSLFGLNSLLAFVPVAFYFEYSNKDPVWVFVASALSIIPLAKLMGEATEELSEYLGSKVGGLLNATLGNAPEIIIGYFALKQGQIEMVKASITGAIIGNLLFGLGVTFIVCDLFGRRKLIPFDLDSFKAHSGLLTLAMFALLIPAVFNFSSLSEREISLEIAIILFLVYVLSIVSTFIPTPPSLDEDDELEIAKVDSHEPHHVARWSMKTAVIVLVVVTALLAVMSESMTGALTPTGTRLGLTTMFMGVFVLALLGNTAELINAVRFARNDKIDLALGILVGGSAQMALMVAPCLVFIGLYLGLDMNLLFSKYEILALIMTVTSITSYLSSGHVKTRAGVYFLAIYLMLGIGFFYDPIDG